MVRAIGMTPWQNCCILAVREASLMGDLAALQQGFPPWKPTPDSAMVAQYRYYDIPLAGVIRQGELEYIFMCIDGHDEQVSLWWFAPIDAEQRKQLETATPEGFDAVLSSMPFHGWSRLALVTENLGIVDYEDVEDSPEGAKRALKALQERVDDLQGDVHRLVLTPH